MSSRDDYNKIHHGMIGDCPVSSYNLYRETAIWNRSLGDQKAKETRRSFEGEKLEHAALGLRTELVLHVDIVFV